MAFLTISDRRSQAAARAAVCAIALCAAGSAVVSAQEAAAPRRFLLRAPAAEAARIASERGLTIAAEMSGKDLFLVEETATTTEPLDATGPSEITSEASSVPVLVEPNARSVIREAASDLRLSEATIAILDSMPDTTPVPYFGMTVWNGYANQTAAQLIRLPEAHRRFATGAGIVAVIDTGVDPTHPILAPALVPGYDFIRNVAGIPSEWDDLDPTTATVLQTDPSALATSAPVTVNEATIAILDEATIAILDTTQLPAAFGHGTMVAGLIRLVAPNARIMPLKAFNADGTGTVYDAVRAIYFAVDNGARIISMSFGVDQPSAELMRAINYATSRGVICVGSAGNAGLELLAFPASFGNVLGVGSTTLTDRNSVFSNFGDAAVRIAAPGEQLITAYPGERYAAAWGTSFSTGLVSGGLALLLQVAPSMTAVQAAEFIRQGAIRNEFLTLGEGRIDLFEALRMRGAVTSSTSANSAPNAVTDLATIAEDAPLLLNVLANDSDAEGDPLSVVSVLQPTNGNAVLVTSGANAGRVNYQPRPNFVGTDSFAYLVSDGMLTSTAVVMVTVTAVNDGPVAVADAATTTEDVPVVIDVLVNDTDSDDDQLTVTSVAAPTSGTAALIATGPDAGKVRYVPNANFAGTDTFTYTVSDGTISETAVVTVTVSGVNDAPVAVDDVVTIGEDASVIIDVLSNDHDTETDPLTVVGVTQPQHGTAAIVASGVDAGKVTYTAQVNYFGTDSFTYTVSDGKGGTATATVAVTVTNVNDAPIAINDEATTPEETLVVIDVRLNDTDPDGDALTVTAVGTPANGSALVTAAGTVSYTPKINFVGTDTFSYTLADGNGGQATATVTVAVTNVNDAPVAVDDVAVLGEDAAAVAVDVLANDHSGPDSGETLIVSVVTQPEHGAAAIITEGPDAGKVTYTPHANYFGADRFTYTIDDGSGGTATASVAVTVVAINDPPTATADTLSVPEDSGATLVHVLSNDSSAPDVDETLTVTTVTSPANGTATLVDAAAGTISYTPTANFVGTDSFIYTVDDGNGGVAMAAVTVTVTNVNDAPAASNDAANGVEDNPVTIDVLTNDSDVDRDTLSVQTVTQPAHGVAAIVASGVDAGRVTYTPAPNFFGSDTFTYVIGDGNGGTATAAVTVTIAGVNDMPAAVPDIVTATEDGESIVINVLGNDSSEPDPGETLTVTAVSSPANGTALLVAAGVDAGAVAYTPRADFAGTDSFTYTIGDGNGGVATASVTILVTSVNDAPKAVDDVITVVEDQAVVFDVRSNDADVDGDALTVESVSPATYGAVTIVAEGPDAGKVSYAPRADFFGSDSFAYTVNDGNGATATATVTLNVTSVNDAPTAGADSAATSEETAIVVDVLVNDADPEGDTLTVTEVAMPGNGVAAVVTAGERTAVSYMPNANFAGIDRVIYTISDGNGGVAMATLTVLVTNINDAPSAVDDAATVAEDHAVTLDVRANDADPDGDALVVDQITQPVNGFTAIVTSGADAGKITYTPNADFFGSDGFSYTLSDGNGGMATANVVVTVNSVNDVPVTTNDTAETSEETAVAINVLVNDSDRDGDALVITALGATANGTAVLVGTDSAVVSYTPNADFAGTESFTYTVSDGAGGEATGTIAVTVTAVNDAPRAVDDAVTTLEDQGVVIDVQANDADPDGDAVGITAVTQPANGVATVIASGADAGKISYTPNADFFGSDTFTYTIGDGAGVTATATVTVTVTSVNDGPVAANDTAETIEETPVVINVLVNDTDRDGDGFTISAVGAPANGTAVVTGADGQAVSYTPKVDFAGTDSFSYTVSDGAGGTAMATVTVSVTGVNDTPVAVADAASVAEDQRIVLDVRANDTDVDGDALTVTGVTQPANGVAALIASGVDGGKVSYTPNADFFGGDTFTYSITDGNGATATATVTLTVTSVNDAPVATSDNAETLEDTAVLLNVLVNDSDRDGEALTITTLGTPANGTAALAGADQKSVSYTPRANFAGTDTFSYTISDGSGGLATATVTVIVTGVNDAPIAVADALTVTEDQAIVVDVKANDTDADGDALILDVVTAPAHGTAVIIATAPDIGKVSYTPNADFHGSDSFTYTISDGNGASATGTVSVTITSVNDAPVAANDSAETLEDTAVLLNVLVNDSDRDGETLAITTVGSPANGTAVVAGADADAVTYTPKPNFAGTDTFSYTVADASGGVATATVTVIVTGVNDAPAAVADAVTILEDQGIVLDVRANDVDADGDALTIAAITQPANGVATLIASGVDAGKVSYTPNADFYGSDSFTYTVSDSAGATATATVAVTVTGVNDGPVAANDSAETAEDTAIVLSVLVNDSDRDGEALMITAVGAPANGTAVLAGADATAVSYTPKVDFVGTDTFTYTVSDESGAVATATVTVAVTGVNDAPRAVDDAATVAEDSAMVVDPRANDADPENDALTVTAVTQPANGVAAVIAAGVDAGKVSYTPNANFFGSDSFTYTIGDGNGGTATAMVTVTVIAVNDLPQAVADAATTVEAGAVVVDVRLNDSDADGHALTVTSVGIPGSGTAEIAADGTVTYTPNAGFVGSDAFAYTIDDGNGGTATATVTVTVAAM